jgi:hypothetical protein
MDTVANNKISTPVEKRARLLSQSSPKLALFCMTLYFKTQYISLIYHVAYTAIEWCGWRRKRESRPVKYQIY